MSNEAAFGNSWEAYNDSDCVPQEDETNPCLSATESVVLGAQSKCDIIQSAAGTRIKQILKCVNKYTLSLNSFPFGTIKMKYGCILQCLYFLYATVVMILLEKYQQNKEK